MRIEAWLNENAPHVDWAPWRERWETMMRGYNPWRVEQNDVLLALSGLAADTPAIVVDLGCGPGGTSECFLRRFPGARVIGVERDPFLLAMAQHGLSLFEERFSGVCVDIRDAAWADGVDGPVDAIVSHTSLHWLSEANQRQLYRNVHSLLRPGGVFLNADHMRSSSDALQGRLSGLTAEVRGTTPEHESWDGYWAALKSDLDFGGALDAMWAELDIWEGTDDGYTLGSYLGSLRDAGFRDVDVAWRSGTRAVIGAVK